MDLRVKNYFFLLCNFEKKKKKPRDGKRQKPLCEHRKRRWNLRGESSSARDFNELFIVRIIES